MTTMTDPTFTLKGLEARVFLDYGVNTTGASAILFDEDANVISETESSRYSGFCTRCIIYSQLVKVYDYRRQVEPADIDNALYDADYSCNCDDDDDEDDE
jgi:hypothetical protein